MTDSCAIVSPPSKVSDVSSQSTLPSFRAMKPSRLAAMWIVTRDFALSIVSLGLDRHERPAGADDRATDVAERDQRQQKRQVIPDRKRVPERNVLRNEREQQNHTG